MSLSRSYSLYIDQTFINHKWSEHEKRTLRPIAETIALLDGNAYFPHNLADNREWYEQYLPEAATIFYNNGGFDGWAGYMSWILEQQHENDAVKDAYETWRVLKKLSNS